MFLVGSVTCVIGINYLYVDRAKIFFSKMLRFQHQGYQMKALLKVDEECHTFRPLERTFQHRKSSLKFKFSLVNVTIDPFLEKKNGNFACKFQIFESEKNFLAVSGSNCQVLPHQNPTEP